MLRRARDTPAQSAYIPVRGESMTGRPTDNGNHVGLAPPDEPVRAEYERDFYSWLMEQARLVREGRWDLVDREHVAEEIESLGREQFNKLESALRVLLMHILKWDHQPQHRSRSWMLTIKDQRAAVEDVLGDNPGLKSRLDEAMQRAYRRARILAARETGLPEEEFPENCPYRYDEAMMRAFER
jgi:hypothetical protein